MEQRYSVTLARPQDAEGINRVLYGTWLATYPNQELGITRELIDMRIREWILPDRVKKRRYLIACRPNGEITLVARYEKRVVALVIVVRQELENRIQALYVLPEFQRKGIGTSLWKRARRHLDNGNDTLLHAVTYNASAIQFYESLGFVDTGKRFTDPKFSLRNGMLLPEMEMIRPRVPAP